MRILKENSFDLRRTRTTLSIRKKKNSRLLCYFRTHVYKHIRLNSDPEKCDMHAIFRS